MGDLLHNCRDKNNREALIPTGTYSCSEHFQRGSGL
jgi:hypothetical protein